MVILNLLMFLFHEMFIVISKILLDFIKYSIGREIVMCRNALKVTFNRRNLVNAKLSSCSCLISLKTSIGPVDCKMIMFPRACISFSISLSISRIFFSDVLVSILC